MAILAMAVSLHTQIQAMGTQDPIGSRGRGHAVRRDQQDSLLIAIYIHRMSNSNKCLVLLLGGSAGYEKDGRVVLSAAVAAFGNYPRRAERIISMSQSCCTDLPRAIRNQGKSLGVAGNVR